LSFQITKRAGRPIEVRPEFTQFGDDVVLGSTQWLDEDGTKRERYQVLTLRDGKIVDMQGCKTRREAERFARRQARR